MNRIPSSISKFIKRQNMKKLEFKCNDCEHVATTTTNLNYHIQSKYNGLRYTCTECDFECSATGNLNWHKTNKFKRDHCDFESFTTGNLRRHTKKSKVKCDQHGFEIYTRGDLKKSMSKNTSKCDQCNFEWSEKGKMIWHKNSKIKCDQCDDDKYFLYTVYLVFASPRRLSIKDMNMIVFVILDISSCVYFLTHAALTHWILGLVHMFLIPYPSPLFFHITSQACHSSCPSIGYQVL